MGERGGGGNKELTKVTVIFCLSSNNIKSNLFLVFDLRAFWVIEKDCVHTILKDHYSEQK